MKFIVDECTGPGVAKWLSHQNFDVFSVYDNARGLKDEDILRKAVSEERILITNDKDFGEMSFRHKKLHKGIILLRLEDERSANKIKIIKSLLEQYSAEINNNFVVVTENNIRIIY
jgi:predicted nuclease of predicted toxin-antitoxin system